MFFLLLVQYWFKVDWTSVLISLQVWWNLRPRHCWVLWSHHQFMAAWGFHGNKTELFGCSCSAWLTLCCWRLRRCFLSQQVWEKYIIMFLVPLYLLHVLQLQTGHVLNKPCGFLPFSAERYDPLTSTWTSVAAMSTRRRYVRVATLGGNQLKICFS